MQNGKVVQSHSGVSPVAAGAVEVDFSSNANVQTLSAINVTANAIPAIDVTTTNQVTTITAKQLQQLPLQRTAENIAMLAPGVNMGSPNVADGPLGNPVNTFGGASTAENAYYLDGMNTTDALDSQGGVSLPYGAILQQQTFISGYGAKYGRSIGGVINQIGKSGSNQWHFGVRAEWEPASWRSNTRNYTWANPLWNAPGESPGDLEDYNEGKHAQEAIYDAYVSGPIVRDKLTFFLAAEQDRTSGTNIGNVENPYAFNYQVHAPKLYAKLNWNINQSNFLTLTGVQNSNKVWTANYNFDYNTLQTGSFSALSQTEKTDFRIWVANYTSYITDNLTLHAMFGKMHGEYYTQQPSYPGFDPNLPAVFSPSVQNPAFVPPGGITNEQVNSTISEPAHRDSVMNYRVSLDYKWHNHDFQAGIDNLNTSDIDDGYTTTGPGYYWAYGLADINKPILGTTPNIEPYVGPPNSNPAGAAGYYVTKWVNHDVASVRVAQRAAYVEDNWQITPNLLLNLGLRDDRFVNYDPEGVPYIRETKPQWAPRFGFSWNVHGDSTLKVFGNAGRYYLAIPAAVALDISAPITTAGLFGTYTGVDPATGVPIGFQPLPQNPSTGASFDNLYGQAISPLVSAARNIRAEFSDNYVLGMQQQFQMLGTRWVFGATGTYQKMSRIIDDVDNEQAECAAGLAQGYSWMTPETCSNWTQSLVLMNPGVTNDLLLKAPDGSLVPVTFTAADQGFPKGPKRRYYSIDLSLTHQWDGKWFGKIDYVFSRTYGNDEGPVDTSTGTSGGSYVARTTAWDFPQLMEWSNGLLPNNRTHQVKIYGAYAINPDWTIGGNLYLTSGIPVECIGHYGPDQTDPLGYGSDYHWCGGKPSPLGSRGSMPMTRILDLNFDYRPGWADHRLDFNLAVFNVFNSQTPTLLDDRYGTTESPNPDFMKIEASESPRVVRFSMAYDF
ncbi:MAG: TonB-dependent receptor plug domain-containing protein [Rhodanobacteraceae bacterium]